ncbi:4-hydroxy-3-methylbut-2-enyl diphosphate reductase [Neorickettsia sp. 179522]|uniref:4-hydroxy-3-methylbut-2-enyl diphosphate reductase n=1 Tax=Neorickettsia sp. 179522 TaxID=1714371 RepID=UPI000799BF28|nr:4-hydroxy-3-methylbut-2-enyl diphosphate reductase [Neorickettsia sp. 179522]KYH12507.1 4-hydroxy-3-methylbut-2-enyl diphosphate reductase [Neorickettsia sp. 179522]
MQIFIASPRGFCAGVERAIETVEIAIRRYPEKKIFVYHEIVHNSSVVQNFEAQGVTFIEDITKVKPESVLIFSAHGVSEEIEKYAQSLDLVLVNATCPLVSKIHREVQRFEKEGFTILVIGNRNHAEIIGTVGRTRAQTYIVQEPEDIDNLPTIAGKLAYVTQSTLALEYVSTMINKIKKKFPNVVGQSDVCYATQNRQETVKALAKKVDLMLIIGSTNSSNSRNLMRVSSKICQKAFLIDNYNEVQLDWFKGVGKIGISSGASAPEILVQDLVSFLKKSFPSTEVSDFKFKKERVQFKLPHI